MPRSSSGTPVPATGWSGRDRVARDGLHAAARPRRAGDARARQDLVEPGRPLTAPPGGPASLAAAAIHLGGFAADSALAVALRAALGPTASAGAGTAAPPRARGGWHAQLRAVGLDWSGADAPAAGQDAILLDLHGLDTPRDRRIWRIVDAAGKAVLSPWFARDRCCRRDPRVSLYLIQSLDGGRSWWQIGAAHLSGWRSYPKLLRAIAAALVPLVSHAVLAPGPATPWQAERGPRRDLPGRWQLAHLRQQLRNKLTADHWAIGLASVSPSHLRAGGPVTPDRWIALPPAKGFVADPFPWPGRPNVLLCERFDHGSGLGRLQALHFGDAADGPVEEVPLDVSSHLSYPFTWEEGGRVYCLPEMAASRRQVLYELSPGQPARPVVTIAENVAMADATLFRHGGLLWLAYTDCDLGLDDNLCLRWAESLAGPWTPHRLNPVKFDLRSTRCAGAVFELDGELLRPAQDCSGGYGSAIVLNRILDCTPDTYREEPVARLLPDPHGPYPDGLHTLSLVDGMLLTDGKRVVLDPRVVMQRIWRRLPRR